MHTITRKIESESIDEFAFDANESAPDFVVTSFTDWLAEYLVGGAAFFDGQTLQYGYALLNCHVHSRVLRLLAPDYQSMPIHWVTDLGPSFQIVAAHKFTAETFGFTPEIPTLLQTALVGRHFDRIPMFGDRLQPVASNPNDSGWFLGSNSKEVDNNDPKQLRVMSLYEAMIAVPHVLRFLSLPIGCQVLFTTSHPVVLQNYNELPIPKESYLDRLFNSK